MASLVLVSQHRYPVPMASPSRAHTRIVTAALGTQYLFSTCYSLLIVNHAVGISPTVGTAAVVAGQIANVVSPPLTGWLSDILGRRSVLISTIAVMAIVVALPTSHTSSALVLMAGNGLVGLASGVWASAGTAALLDIADRHSRHAAERIAVLVGWSIDLGKLMGSLAIAAFAWGRGFAGDLIIAVAVCTTSAGALVSPRRRRPTDPTPAAKPQATTPANVPWWKRKESLILYGFIPTGIAGSQQTTLTVLASHAENFGLAASGVGWALGALLGTAVLLSIRPLRPAHLAVAPAFYSIGMVSVGVGGVLALIGIALIGGASAGMWQSYRGLVLARIDPAIRGRYGGTVVMANFLAGTFGASFLLLTIPHLGRSHVFWGMAGIALIAIPFLWIGGHQFGPATSATPAAADVTPTPEGL